jgi:hypothetical protein
VGAVQPAKPKVKLVIFTIVIGLAFKRTSTRVKTSADQYFQLTNFRVARDLHHSTVRRFVTRRVDMVLP